jgi:hypothetical protein
MSPRLLALGAGVLAACAAVPLADPRAALFSPPSWLGVLAPPGLAYAWLAAFHPFVAGAGTTLALVLALAALALGVRAKAVAPGFGREPITLLEIPDPLPRARGVGSVRVPPGLAAGAAVSLMAGVALVALGRRR